MSIKIITDSGSQISSDQNDENLIVLDMPVISSETEYIEGKDITPFEMFDRMKSEEVFKTSQVSYTDYYNEFKKQLELGNEIIYISLSQGLSSTFQTANMVKNELLKENQNYKLSIKNSNGASIGQRFIAKRALKLASMGFSFDEICEKLDDIISAQEHIFTVNNLEYLYRGGRLSKTQKIMGSLLNIRPILYLSESSEGKIIVKDKARGDKQSYQKIKNLMLEKSKGNIVKNQNVCVCYGENEKDVDHIIEKLKNDFDFTTIEKLPLGCVIGAHTGPEFLGVFFINKDLSDELNNTSCI